MSDNRPEFGANNSNDILVEFDFENDRSELWKKVSSFYKISHAAVDQLENVMYGGGGETGEEAMGRLRNLFKGTTDCFATMANAIIDEYSDDPDTAVTTITNIYIDDEQTRLDRLKRLRENEYADTGRDNIRAATRAIIEQPEDEGKRQNTFMYIYSMSLSTDFNKCLGDGPPENVNEVAARQKQKQEAQAALRLKEIEEEAERERQRKRDNIRDVAKMAGSALLAVALIKFLK